MFTGRATGAAAWRNQAGCWPYYDETEPVATDVQLPRDGESVVLEPPELIV